MLGAFAVSERKHYSERFKRDAASRVIDSNRTQAQVSRDLGLHPTTLGRWVQKERRRRDIERKGSAADNQLQEMHRKNQRLQNEYDRLIKENEFLASTVDTLLNDARAMARYEIISAAIEAGEDIPVSTMCDALGVSRTGFIRWRNRKPSKNRVDQKRLDELVRQIYVDSGEIFGAPRIVKALRKQDIHVGHQTVYRSMYRQGLAGTNEATRDEGKRIYKNQWGTYVK